MRPYHCLPIDANTLAYWRPGERLSLADQGPNGYDLTAQNGATFGETGLVCSRADSQYAASSAVLNLHGKTDLCFEALAQWTGADLGSSDYAHLLYWYISSSDRMKIPLDGQVGGKPRIQVYVNAGGNLIGNDVYVDITDAQYAALKAGMCHFAVVIHFEAGTSYALLYMNGKLLQTQSEATGTAPDYVDASGSMTVGATNAGANLWDGIIDEIQISDSLRYPSPFVSRRFTDGRRAVLRGPEVNSMAGVIA